MKPNVYIDKRTPTFLRFDVGRDRTLAYVTIPTSAEHFTPVHDWCRQALLALSDEAFCKVLVEQGLIEFAFEDREGRRLYAVEDLVVEILTATKLPGGISETPRPTDETAS